MEIYAMGSNYKSVYGGVNFSALFEIEPRRSYMLLDITRLSNPQSDNDENRGIFNRFLDK